MSRAEQYQQNRDFAKTATILDGQSESSIINMHGVNLVGFSLVADLTAPHIQFLVSDKEAGPFEVFKTNIAPIVASSPYAEITVRPQVSKGFFGFAQGDFAAAQFLKIQSVDVDGNAVNQSGSNALIKLVLKPVR